MNIEILDEQVDAVIRALRERIEKIGEKYAFSYNEDVEISALKDVARSLEHTIQATTRAGGFDVIVTKNDAQQISPADGFAAR